MLAILHISGPGFYQLIIWGAPSTQTETKVKYKSWLFYTILGQVFTNGVIFSPTEAIIERGGELYLYPRPSSPSALLLKKPFVI